MVATTLGALLILPSVIKASGVNLGQMEEETWTYKYLNLGKWFGLDEKN
jgi:hypothetical protein